MIAERLCMLQKQIDATALELQKRLSEKSGLMDDLLTGRVRVTPLLA
jgi:type I restriction enzyme S subunit